MFKLKYERIFLFVIIITLISSCVSRKKIIYLQEESSEDVIVNKKMQYRICAHDILHITISSVNPQVTDFFNLKPDGTRISLRGHIVNDSGYIYLPVLDSISVKGLTLIEAQNKIQNEIRGHVTDATVIVKLAAFNITVLGEVASPGLVSFDGDELTILQAIGLARDITEFGNKKKVILLRKEGETTRFITLDLTKRDIIHSEYYYLQPNDVIYVEPLRAKNIKLNAGQISIVMGFTTLVVLMVNLFR